MIFAALTLFARITRSQSPVPVILWCVIGFCAGIFLFVRGFRLLQRRRLILDTPFSKIRSASMGMVEINGLAVGPYTMIAPITARPCYYYRTLAWEYKQHGKNKEWVKVAGESMHLPFFVDDNTGRVLVDPRGADLDLHCDFKEEFSSSFFSTSDPQPTNVSNFLARHGVVTDNKVKIEEYCIKPKNALFILGTLAENPGIELAPDPIQEDEPLKEIVSRLYSQPINSILGSSSAPADGAYSGDEAGSMATQRAIRLSTPKAANTLDMSQQQKIAAALTKAGIVNPAAWSAAGFGAPGVQAVSPGAVSSDGTNAFDPHPPVVLKKGNNNGNFLISWRSQQEVAGSLGWKCALMIPGGPALTVLSLYLLLRFFHQI